MIVTWWPHDSHMIVTWWPHGRYWSTSTQLQHSCYIWLQERELCLLVKITELWFLFSDWLTWSVPTKHWTCPYSSSWGIAMDIISLTSQIVFWDTTVGEHFQKKCSQATFWGTRSFVRTKLPSHLSCTLSSCMEKSLGTIQLSTNLSSPLPPTMTVCSLSLAIFR